MSKYRQNRGWVCGKKTALLQGQGCPLTQSSLRLLSFNIQAGIHTFAYRHYLTKSWQHILPSPKGLSNLDTIASCLAGFDIVALQEVDGGSLRSGFTNQVDYLGKAAGLTFRHQQLNRNLGRFGQYSNGLLSRFQPWLVEDHRLPGRLPGRGAIFAYFGSKTEPLLVVSLHLALSRRVRDAQLAYIAESMAKASHVVVLGDLNMSAKALEKSPLLRSAGLRMASIGVPTYPSWKPSLALDHILVSPLVKVLHVSVLEPSLSDHLPLAVEIAWPFTS